ncbi:hypothetical protein AK812_SmicGene4206 [Symbiodinium microadriaticum]|uniref:SET domain-containing protein n=1 Tax=Symbiodinium microadriaticum TaxID=2951 RepID=A0A1Q9EX83_SYMMI|nr:hypothetical protein AK812_SmicGene4206 [Symbiodinium microadriaticum]
MAADGREDLKEVREAFGDGSAVDCRVSETKGRILVAKSSFAVGELIYVEPPLHIIQEDEACPTYLRLEALASACGLKYAARWYWYALNCLTASDFDPEPPLPGCCIISEGLQRQLLLLCTPDEKASAVPALRSLLAELSGPVQAAEKVWKLLQVWKFNSFECGEDPVSSAVYFRTSFHSHDCNPNASWTANSKDLLELRARRCIDVGEEVTISYLSDEELFEATSERRYRLELSKELQQLPSLCPFDVQWEGDRQLASDAGGPGRDVVSDCTAPSPCTWSVERTAEVLQKEELLVRLYRQHSDSDLAVRLDLARRFASAAEQIFPRTDRFVPSDDLYGPNIYTVNKQYIMPVTVEAGKVSWALMRHPEGLDCDVFISHAWQEGVFEFLSKVLHSWPAGSRHVWCCMLANPQNLDISSFLQSPSNSPFAQALKASSCVLVVPNRHCSIYTRLWCGYEAYIAHEEGKVIFIARPSYSNHIGAALISATLVGLTGMLCGAFLLLRRCELHPIPLYAITTSAFISININHYRSRMLLNRLGAFTCGIVLLEWTTVNFDGAQGPSRIPGIILCVEQRLLILAALSFFLLLETDRVNAEARAWEAEQLRRGYQGSIAHATCSDAADSARILGEIGGKMEAVDYAIHVLLKAGMSSPTLREIARAGIDVEGAGNAVMAFPVVALVPLNLETLWSTYVDMAS